MISLLGAIAIFFLQKKGFLYQLIPALGISTLILGIGYSEMMQYLSRAHRVLVSALLATSCALCLVYMFLIYPIRSLEISPVQQAITQYTKKDEAVLVLSSTVYDSYPVLVRMHRKLGSRYLTTFPFSFLPKMEDYSVQGAYVGYEQLSKNEKEFIQVLLADIRRVHPKLLLIKNSAGCQGCPKYFNIYYYLNKIDFIDQISRDYSRKEDIKDFAVYVYQPEPSRQ